MSIVRFDVIIQSSTGLPADSVVNSWHFQQAGASPLDYDNVRDMLRDFYTLARVVGGVSKPAISTYIPSATTAATALVKGYKVGSTPGSPPDYSSSFSLGGRAGVAALPSEVALCLSFQAARQDGVNQARLRNRKYIGPLAINAIGGNGRPIGDLQSIMGGAAKALKLAADASVSWEWVVYSPTTGSADEVIDGWIDNAWDSQRRRGLSPSARFPFSASLPG